MHVAHPLLRPGAVEFRGYQANLARIAARTNTLVVLPTGMGKTVVALLAIVDALQAGASRVLLLAPTRPLVEQHQASLAAALAPEWAGRVAALTGDQAPESRSAVYAAPGIVAATPQVVQNDIVAGRLDLAHVDLLVFDEAHRGVGDYPYAFIGLEARRRNPSGRRLGLTASPGHDLRKMEEVRSNLGLANVEVRTATDPDVSPYVQEVAMEWEVLPMPPAVSRVSAKLHEALAERIRVLKGQGFLKSAGSRPNRRELLELAGTLQSRIKATTNPDPSLYAGLSLQAQAIKLQHAIELAETQGAAACAEYLANLRTEAQAPKSSKANRTLAEDARVNEAYQVARFDDSENPKLGRTGTLVQMQLEANPEGRIIVFTHYRSTSELVAGHLAKLAGVRPKVFVGQGRRSGQDGMTQREQKAVLEEFRAGTHNVLVATSVAEEGLDIPETDLVVFYEPIASEIRSIQRRGRTGRRQAGRVVVLMAKGTQDEAAHWSAKRKEQDMARELQNLRAGLGRRPLEAPGPGPGVTGGGPASAPVPSASATGANATQRRLDDAPPQTPAPIPRASSLPSPPGVAPGGPRIIYDHREQSGGVVRHLHELGCALEVRQLEVADFVLSDRVAVERKQAADFVSSLLDGRLFAQLKDLKAYPRPFLVIEGDALSAGRNVSPEAVAGALASIAIDFGIPVLQFPSSAETARFLHAAAKREQDRDGRKLALRHAKPAELVEQQRFLVEGLPGVSATLAARLLERFGSASAVFAASDAQLQEVEGVGPQRAAEMRRVLDALYLRRLTS